MIRTIADSLFRSHTDWWTWTDPPDTTDSAEQLALDPSYGSMRRPHLTDMLALADERRNGRQPRNQEGAWGAAIGMLPDLRTFELVLETFVEKKKQLEAVVDCAKTWKFPLADTRCELIQDGKIESLSWKKDKDDWETDSSVGFVCGNGLLPPPEGSSDESETDGELDDNSEGDNDARMDTGAELQAGEDSAGIGTNFPASEASNHHDGDGSNIRARRNSPPPPLSLVTATASANPEAGPSVPHHEMVPTDEPVSPFYHGYSGDSRPTSPYSPAGSQRSSPHYSPTSPAYIPDSPGNWHYSSTEFEVRVVRFRRRQME